MTLQAVLARSAIPQCLERSGRVVDFYTCLYVSLWNAKQKIENMKKYVSGSFKGE